MADAARLMDWVASSPHDLPVFACDRLAMPDYRSCFIPPEQATPLR